MIRPDQLGVASIAPVPRGLSRPVWSVMIPVYNRVTWLTEAIASALGQFSAGDDVQIEVVDDASDASHHVAEIVRQAGGGRVGYHRQSNRLGMVGNWNDCLARSRGQFVHLLHDDDFVLPGFYRTLGEALRQYRDVGLAFCAVHLVDRHGKRMFDSNPLAAAEILMPAWENWIGLNNQIVIPGPVIRRSALEAVGGFHPGLTHAVDWEMWMRLAAHFAVWHTPRILACHRQHPESETMRQTASAENIEDIPRALELARSYMRPEVAEEQIARSKQVWAGGVMTGARSLSGRGSLVMGLAWARAASRLGGDAIAAKSLEQEVVREFIGYMQKVEALLGRLRESATADVIEQARLARQQLVGEWQIVPATELRTYAETELGRLHRLFLTSRACDLPADGQDLALLEKPMSPMVAAIVGSLFPAGTTAPANEEWPAWARQLLSAT